ncbi:MAG TPA: tryptophan--tRNA ligase, partial [Spirochaetota bacterium]|nr:tryptophan--tRNA ligase [Spirochaetota bacterium]
DEVESLRTRYISGGFGYGDAKKLLLGRVLDYFKVIREKYFQLKKDVGYVEKVLKEGGEKARNEAVKTLKEVRDACGII